MGGRPPAPQRPPNAREQALIDAIRGYLNEPVDGPDEWLQRIEGLRNIEVDAEAIWEEAVVRAKAAGATWGALEASTGMAFSTLQTRIREESAQTLAALPRQSNGRRRPIGADQRKRAKARAVESTEPARAAS